MENKWQEMLFDFSNNPYYISWVGIEPRMTGCKSETLTRNYLPDYKSMVNIKLNFFAGVPCRCSLFELFYACAPHRPPQAASVRCWKRSRSVLFGHLIHVRHSRLWAGYISRERV